MIKIFMMTMLSIGFSTSALAFNVIIDPGHGGSDDGAVHNGSKESDIVLKIGKIVRDELSSDSKFQVFMTRNTNQFLALESRADFANQNKGDLFVSIHANSSPNPRARGKEIYFQNQLPADEEAYFLANLEQHGLQSGGQKIDPKSKNQPDVMAIVEDLKRNQRLALSGKLAELVHENWPTQNIRRSRPIRQAPFYVISNVNMPSVLIELGYVTNGAEAKKLSDKDHQIRLAKGIVTSIKKIKDFIDKQTTTTLD